MLSTNDIRALFLKFFEQNEHKVLPSSPLVPQNDPTLMFTNAGMVQFKNIFTGMEKSAFPRAATSQKCVRAGGKHNDLDNVGYTARHHTFFEMLGNFSFGDYFKERAIELAWKFLTVELKIPADKLWITVYHTDDEAWDIWKKVTGFPDKRIIRIPTNDNFWAMGDTGPCGPCSEIYYNYKDEDPTDITNAGDDCIEIWNLVFMQFEQVSKDERVSLPRPSIDTGMGLERVAAVLQGTQNNYEIDLFKSIISDIEREVATLAKGQKTALDAAGILAAHRVIADHLRASCFLIADGVLPSNEGRGYVLRRIMRRAMRYAHQLGCKEPLMWRLVPSLEREMGKAFPELGRASASIVETLKQEEERFKQTLEKGLKLLEEETAKLTKGGKLPGEAAFKLYDTYGFPLDLTQDILRGLGMEVDTDGFEASMDKQREGSKAAWTGSGEKATSKVWFDLREKLGATHFVGYSDVATDATILALVVNGQPVQSASAGDEVAIITDKTPFYGESGGQVGDAGEILNGAKTIGIIADTLKPMGDFHVHYAKLSADVKVGDAVTLQIDVARRDRTRANHSATHILHEVLRRQLGEHITQKGSLVAHDRLRFDISHPKGLSREEIANIEHEVNRIIWLNTDTHTENMTPDAAMKKGAMALFGEKYGDEVRVISMGAASGQQGHSIELCGGTHVRRTGDIGLFKIVNEAALAAGVRRLEALTGPDAFTYLAAQEMTLKELANNLKTNAEQLPARIDALVAERKKFEKELADAKKAIAMGGGSGGSEAAKEMIGDIAFSTRSFDDMPPKELRPLAEGMLKQLGNGIAVVASGFEGKASLVIAVSKDLSSRISAADLIQVAVPVVGGKGGGGRPDMAQGGGPEAGKLVQAIDAVRAKLQDCAKAA